MRGPLFEGNAALTDATMQRNSALQGAYLLIAARMLGLDCGPMSGFDAAKLNSEFFPDGRWRANFLINLGYGDASGNYPRGRGCLSRPSRRSCSKHFRARSGLANGGVPAERAVPRCFGMRRQFPNSRAASPEIPLISEECARRASLLAAPLSRGCP